MVLFNYALKELTAKIVYYGPGLSGKTTNLQYIYEELPIKNKGRMLTLATETDRTLYFDFLPVDAGVVRGIKTRVQLYTVPGQVFYNATRRMVLKGADGVVFVADSQENMMEANLESLENLRENLAAHDLELEEMPIVLQFNKRDLDAICTIEEMNDRLNALNAPFYEAVAKDGVGVEDTLQAISGLVLKSVIDRYGGERSMKPLGQVGKAKDPAQTDPEALVSASIARGAGGSAGKGGGARKGTAQDIHAQTAANWPLSEDDDVAAKGDEPKESFENLNIEGILDEALKLDEPEAKAPSPASPRAAKNDDEASMFSGLLDDAFSAEKTDSILGDAAAPADGSVPESDAIADLEAELLGGDLEPEPNDDPASNLSELIKTKVSISRDQITTTPPVKAPSAGGTKRIEVPVDVEIDGSEEQIELLLKIRLKRK